MVSERMGAAESEQPAEAHQPLHIALVVPDIGTYQRLRKKVWVIKPAGYKDDIKIHFLLQGKDKTDSELTFSFALTDLGLITPEVGQIQYPENIELGWSDDTAPINRE
jgi:hypothetical protein